MGNKVHGKYKTKTTSITLTHHEFHSNILLFQSCYVWKNYLQFILKILFYSKIFYMCVQLYTICLYNFLYYMYIKLFKIATQIKNLSFNDFFFNPPIYPYT